MVRDSGVGDSSYEDFGAPESGRGADPIDPSLFDSNITIAQMQDMSAVELAALSREEVRRISPEALRAIPAGNIKFLSSLSDLDPRVFAELTADQIRGISTRPSSTRRIEIPAQIDTITEAQIRELGERNREWSGVQYSRMSGGQKRAIREDIREELEQKAQSAARRSPLQVLREDDHAQAQAKKAGGVALAILVGALGILGVGKLWNAAFGTKETQSASRDDARQSLSDNLRRQENKITTFARMRGDCQRAQDTFNQAQRAYDQARLATANANRNDRRGLAAAERNARDARDRAERELTRVKDRFYSAYRVDFEASAPVQEEMLRQYTIMLAVYKGLDVLSEKYDGFRAALGDMSGNRNTQAARLVDSWLDIANPIDSDGRHRNIGTESEMRRIWPSSVPTSELDTILNDARRAANALVTQNARSSSAPTTTPATPGTSQQASNVQEAKTALDAIRLQIRTLENNRNAHLPNERVMENAQAAFVRAQTARSNAHAAWMGAKADVRTANSALAVERGKDDNELGIDSARDAVDAARRAAVDRQGEWNQRKVAEQTARREVNRLTPILAGQRREFAANNGVSFADSDERLTQLRAEETRREDAFRTLQIRPAVTAGITAIEAIGTYDTTSLRNATTIQEITNRWPTDPDRATNERLEDARDDVIQRINEAVRTGTPLSRVERADMGAQEQPKEAYVQRQTRVSPKIESQLAAMGYRLEDRSGPDLTDWRANLTRSSEDLAASAVAKYTGRARNAKTATQERTDQLAEMGYVVKDGGQSRRNWGQRAYDSGRGGGRSV